MSIDLEQPLVDYVSSDAELYDSDTVVESSTDIDLNDEENRRSNVSVTVDGLNVNSSSTLEPHDGMEFDSKEEAFTFYKEYAKSVGFSTIIKASRRSRISGKFIDAKFVCTRYGKKRESSTAESPDADCSTSNHVKRKRGRTNKSGLKTDCKACMHVKKRQDGSWVIYSLIKEHNHVISPDREKKMSASKSKRTAGYNKKGEDLKGSVINETVNKSLHLILEEGDAQVMLDNFMCMQDENPYFFYAIDLNKEQRLRNVFWVDAKSRLDYGYFSDVVFFDTTYIKKEYKLPLAFFFAVNHHFHSLLLGCALIADESKSTYAWLIRTWLKAMGGRAPRVILTDQDQTLKEAIAEVLPDSRHFFCLWNILSKIPEKLSYVTRQHENFMTKFNKCILKSWTSDQFEKRWLKMLDNFDLRNDLWIKSLYEDRQRWVPSYTREIFLAGQAQRSENTIYSFGKYLQRKTFLKDFLVQYKTFLNEKCEEEAIADSEKWNKKRALKSPSPFGKQMANIYTHSMFKKFQVEVLGVVACHPKKERESGPIVTYKVQDFEENQEFTVVWNENTSNGSCLCRLFEGNGYLCRHMMIVLQMCGRHTIPPHYILKRWTKDAKNRETTTQGSSEVESRTKRYNDLCRRAFKLGDEGSLSKESFRITFTALEEALRKCVSVHNTIQSVIVDPKKCISNKRKVLAEPDFVTIAVRDSWQQMEQINSRVETLDDYFSTEGHKNSLTPRRDDYYGNQQKMQELEQLNSTTPVHEGHYLTQQRVHRLGHLQFRAQTFDSCFELGDDLQEMDQSNVEPTHFHGMASKHMHPKHRSR